MAMKWTGTTWASEGSVGGGSSFNSGGLRSLIDNYNKSYAEAKNANERRYQQMLGIADQTTGQRMADVRSDYTQRGANIFQNLSRLGMGNTTVAPTMQLGVDKEMQSSLNRTADDMQATKLGIIERRQDAYPDSAGLMQLIASLSNGNNTQGLLSAMGGLRF